MLVKEVAKILANRINQEHYILHYMNKVFKAGQYEQHKKTAADLITDIDHRLSVIEDYANGEAGIEITKLRKYIEETYGKDSDL